MDTLRLSPVQQEYSAPSEADIDTIAREVQQPIPEQYRKFFCAFGGQAPGGYAYFGFLSPHPTMKRGVIDVFFGVIPGDSYDIFWNLQTYKGRIPSKLLPIASDPGGNIICLSLQGQDLGSVYFWDHSREEDVGGNEEPGFSNVYLIARSLDEFINSLEMVPDDDE